MEEIIKNQTYTAAIGGYSSDGAGVCRIGSRAVFVKGALDGEIWKIKIVKATDRMALARGETLISPSSCRIEPACPHFVSCGGCSLLHMTYTEELRLKINRVNDAFRHIGGLDFKITEISGAENRFSCRSKVIYAVGEKQGEPVRGFYRRRSHDIVPVSRCIMQPELFDRAADTVLKWMRENSVQAYNEIDCKGCVRRIFLRRAYYTGEAVCCIVTASKIETKKSRALVSALASSCPELTGVVLNINKSPGNTVLSGEFFTLSGIDTIKEELCGLIFELSPVSFFQVNPEQAQKLFEKIVEYAKPEEKTVLDLYCGAGAISLIVAKTAKRVIGADTVKKAVINAEKNAVANKIRNAEFICSDALEAAKLLQIREVNPDLIIVDPPRKGLAAGVIDTIAEIGPPQIIYVSCDPGTLARDLKIFCGFGYFPDSAAAVDMFPGTEHVETVVLLSKLKSTAYTEVKIDLDEMDFTRSESKATYDEIKQYVLDNAGLKVASMFSGQ